MVTALPNYLEVLVVLKINFWSVTLNFITVLKIKIHLTNDTNALLWLKKLSFFIVLF